MTLAEFTERGLLIPELLNERRESAVGELSKRLAHAGCIENARVFAQAVLEHESLVSTIFDQVAFCLARGHTARKLSFAMGMSKYGIHWSRPEAPPVFIVVLFSIPASGEEQYLSVIMAFTSLLNDKTLLSSLREAQDSDAILKVLSRVSVRGRERD